MNRSPWLVTCGWAILGLLCGEIGRRLLTHSPASIPLATFLPILLVACVLAWYGWQVRRLRKGEESNIDRLTAARVYAFAQAAIRTGALMSGFFGVLALAYAVGISTAWTNDQTLSVALACLASIVLTGVGIVVEHWCRIDPRDDEPETGQTPAVGPQPGPQVARDAHPKPNHPLAPKQP